MRGGNLLRWVDIQRKGKNKKNRKPEEYGGTAVQRKKGKVKSKNKNEITLQGLLIDSGDTRLKSPVATHILGFSKERHLPSDAHSKSTLLYMRKQRVTVHCQGEKRSALISCTDQLAHTRLPYASVQHSCSNDEVA